MREAAREVAAAADRPQLIEHERGEGAVLVGDTVAQLVQMRPKESAHKASGRIRGLILRRLVLAASTAPPRTTSSATYATTPRT